MPIIFTKGNSVLLYRNLYKSLLWYRFSALVKLPATLQSIMNVKLSQHGFED